MRDIGRGKSSSETQGFKGDGKGRERLGAGKKRNIFLPAHSLSLPFPSPLKPWVSKDDFPRPISLILKA